MSKTLRISLSISRDSGWSTLVSSEVSLPAYVSPVKLAPVLADLITKLGKEAEEKEWAEAAEKENESEKESEEV